MKHMKFMASVLFGITVLSVQAKADDYKVYEPKVNKGEMALETNLNYSWDHNDDQDKYFSQVYAGEYGITDWWQTELGGEVEKENYESNTLTNLKWENIITPWAPGENPVDVGFYFEFEKSMINGEPNNLEGKLLLSKDIGDFSNTANLIVERQVGRNSETGLAGGAAFKSIYRMDKAFQPGIEYYADFGKFSDMGSFNDQEHLLGPVAEGKIGPVKYDTGLLFGVSDAANDATLKLNLEYEF